MARIFITGSADGLGFLTAKALIELGHQVVLHARNSERGRQTKEKLDAAAQVLTADLSSMKETIELAEKVNALGTFDVIIHNAGIYQVPAKSVSTDGLPMLFAVNSVAPYILTAAIEQPRRLIYLSSDMHLQGSPDFDQAVGSGNVRTFTYSDTKLHNLLLSMAAARKWPEVVANAVNPGWVPTKMGGFNAPDSLDKGFETQVWLAVSNETRSTVSGRYFYHKKEVDYLPAANDPGIQDQFLALCEQVTGIPFPFRPL